MKKITWGSAAIGTLIIGAVVGTLYLEYHHEKDARKVEVIVETKAWCDENYPIAVTVNNNSSRPVTSIDLEIEVREKGHSTTQNFTIHDDHIVAPNYWQHTCWNLGTPPPRPNLTYSLAEKSIHF